MNNIGNNLYVFGGTNGYDYYREILKFDLVTRVWEKVIVASTGGCAPQPMYKHACVTHFSAGSHKLLILGGLNQAVYSTIHEFDLSAKRWTEIKAQNLKVLDSRFAHTACLSPDRGSVFIFGGSGTSKFDDIIKYDMSQKCFFQMKIQDDDKTPTARDFSASFIVNETHAFDADCLTGNFCVIGGSDKNGRINDIHSFVLPLATPSDKYGVDHVV